MTDTKIYIESLLSLLESTIEEYNSIVLTEAEGESNKPKLKERIKKLLSDIGRGIKEFFQRIADKLMRIPDETDLMIPYTDEIVNEMISLLEKFISTMTSFTKESDYNELISDSSKLSTKITASKFNKVKISCKYVKKNVKKIIDLSEKLENAANKQVRIASKSENDEGTVPTDFITNARQFSQYCIGYGTDIKNALSEYRTKYIEEKHASKVKNVEKEDQSQKSDNYQIPLLASTSVPENILIGTELINESMQYMEVLDEATFKDIMQKAWNTVKELFAKLCEFIKRCFTRLKNLVQKIKNIPSDAKKKKKYIDLREIDFGSDKFHADDVKVLNKICKKLKDLIYKLTIRFTYVYDNTKDKNVEQVTTGIDEMNSDLGTIFKDSDKTIDLFTFEKYLEDIRNVSSDAEACKQACEKTITFKSMSTIGLRNVSEYSEEIFWKKPLLNFLNSGFIPSVTKYFNMFNKVVTATTEQLGGNYEDTDGKDRSIKFKEDFQKATSIKRGIEGKYTSGEENFRERISNTAHVRNVSDFNDNGKYTGKDEG